MRGLYLYNGSELIAEVNIADEWDDSEIIEAMETYEDTPFTQADYNRLTSEQVQEYSKTNRKLAKFIRDNTI